MSEFKTLAAHDGADFETLIEELPEGQWRPSARCKLDRKFDILALAACRECCTPFPRNVGNDDAPESRGGRLAP